MSRLLYNYLLSARRIVIAEYASLTYRDFLPALMGEATVNKSLLQPDAQGPGVAYLKEVLPGILTSFAVAAFRNPMVSTRLER